MLKLTVKGAADDGAASAASSARPKSTESSESDASDDFTARALGVTGLVVGVLGLAAAAFTIVRTRSTRGGDA